MRDLFVGAAAIEPTTLGMVPVHVPRIFAQATGVSIHPDRAMLRALVFDCEGTVLEGAEVEIDGVEVAYEIANAPRYDLEATTAEGTAWAFDVAPGIHEVVVRYAPTGQVLFSGELPFQAGAITTVRATPR